MASHAQKTNPQIDPRIRAVRRRHAGFEFCTDTECLNFFATLSASDQQRYLREEADNDKGEDADDRHEW
jgi:hypothetical protein